MKSQANDLIRSVAGGLKHRWQKYPNTEGDYFEKKMQKSTPAR